MKLLINELHAAQQPIWPDDDHLVKVISILEQQVPLTRSKDSDRLSARLSSVAQGKAFILQAGPCAESFQDTPKSVRDLLNVILPMTVVLGFGAGVPVIKIGRFAGQFAKPRSSDEEVRGDKALPSYRGDIVNSPGFTVLARQPNPDRLLKAYKHSKRTLRVIDELTMGGFADLEKMHRWNVKFAARGSKGERERYQIIANGISKAISFMKACGINVAKLSELHTAKMFISHEALLLDYESALTRLGGKGKLYDSSAHMLWIGERTRKLEDAHVAFCAAIANPIGVKLGPTATVEEVLGLCKRLNPKKIPGRLTFITRMGVNTIGIALPPLLKAVRQSGYPVIWVCDPMHGNTITAKNGQKTRRFKAIIGEVENFFKVCRANKTWPGGVHLEITGEDVTECLGGSSPTKVTDLSRNYTTNTDPRLNPTQSIELAFLISELLTKN